MSRRLPQSLLVLALAVSGCRCSDPVDQAAKKRIFSPEDPPQVVGAAKEALPADRLGDDPNAARRVLAMDEAEATERLGAHQYKATLTYDWKGGQGAQTKLTETRTLQAGAGGVAGDFHGVLENSRDLGLEVLRVDGKVYARNRYGQWRLRTRDRGMAERVRTELTGALRDVSALFRNRLALAPQGSATYEGRTAQRYQVSLAPASQAAPDTAEGLPAPLEPKGGADDATRHRQAFFAQREPTRLTGELLVDEQTGVVLKAILDGRLRVPASKGGGAAELALSLNQVVDGLGRDPRLKPPESFLPDADKPQGIADALDRFGVPRQGAADAGTPAPGAPSEPGDDDEAP